MEKKRATKEAIIADLQRVFKKLGTPFTASEYNRTGIFAGDTVTRRIGSWDLAIKLAGLQKSFDECKKVQTEIRNFDPAKENMKKYEEEKKKMRDREKDKEHKELKKRKMATDIVIENIRDSILKLPPAIIEIHQYPEPKMVADKGHCTLWLEISDIQLGSYVTKTTSGGLNEHNWKIWKSKLRKWIDGVKEIIEKTRREYKIDGVILSQLGDMVEGHQIFSGQAYQLDQDVYFQMAYGSEDLTLAYMEIALAFPDIMFHLEEVAGNHGRVGKINEAPFVVNFDNILFEFIRLRLGQHPDIKNIKMNKNLSWFKIVKTYGWTHLLIHGDRGLGGKWGGSLTINSLERCDSRYQKLLKQIIHYTHLGHFHHEVTISDASGAKLVNGCWPGTTSYASDITAGSTPLQAVYLITPKNGVEQTFYVYLKDRREDKPEIPIDTIIV